MQVMLDELIHRVRDKSAESKNGSLTLAQSRTALESVIGVLKDIILDGDKTMILGFGEFGSKMKEAHQGNNLATGQRITIPRHMIPYFKPSQTLRKEVAGT